MTTENTPAQEVQARYSEALYRLNQAEDELNRATLLEDFGEVLEDGHYKVVPMTKSKSKFGLNPNVDCAPITIDRASAEAILRLNRERKVAEVRLAQKLFQEAAALRLAE
ncbi:MAG: hypothetical protein HYV27_15135 [Candidatus Hydrogenedentes bacterium]|nr:hypothetical protein [Candidatus Hydrogenedentota bacterium]